MILSRRNTRAAALLIAAHSLTACAYMGKRVPLTYIPSRTLTRPERKTPLLVETFLDKRPDKQSLGMAPAGPVSVPLRAKSNVRTWVTDAAIGELAAAGYSIVPGADWKLGGAIHEASCVGTPRTVCTVRIEIWLHMKDNWEVLKRQYRGEGSRPALLPEEDPYELSLQEALREILTNFRRDAELLAP